MDILSSIGKAESREGTLFSGSKVNLWLFSFHQTTNSNLCRDLQSGHANVFLTNSRTYNALKLINNLMY